MLKSRRFLLVIVIIPVLGLLVWLVRPPAAPPVAQASGTLTGTVYQDYNANGQRDLSSTLANNGAGTVNLAFDRGLAGVTVTAYDGTGTISSTTTSAANGTYSLVIAGTGPYRVEFTTLPAGFHPAPFGLNNATTVRFVPDGNSSSVDLGILLPHEYCQNNPELATACYVYGDQITGPNNTSPVLVSSPYSAGSTRTTGAAPFADFDAPTTHALMVPANQLGPTWGMAYQRITRQLYAAALMKKHAGFGPGGPGAVYKVDWATGATSVYANLNTLFGAGTAGVDPHNPADYDTDNGNATWDAVGKAALGGLAVSDDDTRLYVINLANRTLYEMPLDAAPTAGNIRTAAVPTALPGCPAAGDARPFAVNYESGLVYVGVICSAESTQNAADLQAHIYTVDPATLVFNAAPVFSIPLNYPRGVGNTGTTGQFAEWVPWTATFNALPPTVGQNNWNFPVYPQPILTDIAFDNGTLILGLRDRFGDQTGSNNFDNPSAPPGPPTPLYNGVTAGDVLRACSNGAGGWVLESNGRCGGLGTAPQNTGQGPGNGEYYFKDFYSPYHDEVAIAGLAQIPGYPDMVTTVFDPIALSGGTFDGGLRWFSNATGDFSKAYRIYDGDIGNGVTFAKANGLGDLVPICEAAPIEIGNFVWLDTDKDGVQDPGEQPIPGVTVRLYAADGTLLATAITDANGQYYFSSAPGTSTSSARYGISSLSPNTANFTVRLDNALDYAAGGPLNGYSPTLLDSDPSANGNSRDSDGAVVGGFPRTTFNTGGPGHNNHTYDFGFATNPTAAQLVSFRAYRLFDGAVTVEWVTAAEVDTARFTLYRAPTLDFSQAAAIHTINAARRPGGSTYTFADQPAGAGPWWYWLESSSTTGELTRYPPASTAAGRLAQPYLVFLPTVGRQ